MIISEHAKLEIITKSNKKYDVDESYIVEKSLTTTQSCSSGGGIPAGSCNAGTMSVSFRAPAGMSKKDLFMAKIKLYVWYGSGDPKQIGEYNVTSSTKNGNVYTVSASDNIVLLDENCYSAKDVQDAENGLIEILGGTLRDPATILSFICNTYSVPHLNHDENVEKVPDSGNVKLFTSVSNECSTESVKDFASYIAEYLGAFIVADENGKVRFCRLGDREPDIEINSSNIAIGTYQRSPYYVFPSMWRVCFDSGFSNYWYASPVPADAAPLTVDVTNNPFWQYQEDNIPSDLYAGKTTGMIALPWDYIYNAATDENGKHLINPFSATVYVPYLFRVCDLVTIKDPDTNEKYRTYITDVTWTFRGGQTISCAGEDTRTLSVSKSRSMAKRGTDYSKYLYRKSKKSGESSNTTYKLTKTGHTISLKGSDGSESTVNDSDTIYTHPTHTSHSKGMYKFANDGLGHVSDAEKVTKEDIVELGIPGNDTTYTAGTGLSISGTTINHKNSVAAKTTAGFLKFKYDAQGHITGSSVVTKDDITRLGIPGEDTNTTYTLTRFPENSSFRNQLLFSDGSKNDYISIKPDIFNMYGGYPTSLKTYLTMIDSRDVSDENSIVRTNIETFPEKLYCTWQNYGSGFTLHIDGYIDAKPATQSTKGLMSAADKAKLDNIADSANNYVHPTTSGNKHIPSGGSSGQILRWSADGTAVWGDDKDTTYSNATQSASGLMTAEDKTKLDGIAIGANKTVVDTALSSTSTNPVQNKVVKAALDGKAASSHTHSQYYDSSISRTANTVLAAPNGSAGSATFRKLVVADIPTGWWNAISYIHEDGVMEIGKYIDFHTSSSSTADYDVRITAGSTGLTISGTTKGTFSGSLSGNASSATKLKTARTINGVTFDGSADITIPRSTLSLHTARGTVGSAGYVKIATFTISSAYRNSVITIEFTRRGYIPVVLYIRWANVNGTDPDLEYFRFVHPTSMTNNAFMHKSDTSTWDLYIKKSENNDYISIIDCKKPSHMSGVTITWDDVHSSSLPDGYVAATRMGVDTDSGWLTLTGNVKYRKIGNIVEVRGTYTAPSSGGGMTIGTLPTGYRPSNATVYNTNSISDTASKTYYTSVNTSGTLIISSSSGSAFTQGIAYNVNIMFMVD